MGFCLALKASPRVATDFFALSPDSDPSQLQEGIANFHADCFSPFPARTTTLFLPLSPALSPNYGIPEIPQIPLTHNRLPIILTLPNSEFLSNQIGNLFLLKHALYCKQELKQNINNP